MMLVTRDALDRTPFHNSTRDDNNCLGRNAIAGVRRPARYTVQQTENAM